MFSRCLGTKISGVVLWFTVKSMLSKIQRSFEYIMENLSFGTLAPCISDLLKEGMQYHLELLWTSHIFSNIAEVAGGPSWSWGWSETRYGEANKWGPNVLTHTVNIQNYKSWAQEWGFLVLVTFSGCTSVFLQAYSQIYQSLIDYSFRSKWLKFITFLHHPLWLYF